MSDRFPFAKDEYKGIFTSTSLWVEKIDNGLWDISYELIQRRRKSPESKWEEKIVNMKVTSDDLEKGVSEVLLSIMMYLEKYNGDLFTKDIEQDTKGLLN